MNTPSSSSCPHAQGLASRFNPFKEPYVSDPYPFFAEARAATPVFHSKEQDCWVVTRYEDMRQIFQNPKQFSACNALSIKPVCPAAGQAYVEANFNSVPTLTITDPPAHTRIRRLSNIALSPQRVTDLEPLVRDLTARFVKTHRAAGRADLIRDLAWDLPALVVFRLLGVADEELPQVTGATVHSKLVLWGDPNEQEQVHAAQGIGAFWKYIVRLVARRNESPRDDFTSALLQARAADLPPLTPEETCSIIFGIMVAGHETTTALLAHGVNRLLTHREAWEAIVKNPALIPNAVEEILRMDSSVVGWRRMTTEPVEIGGIPVPAHATVLMLLGSANRDPAVFENPETFDIHRANAKHNLSFGFGNHLCIGAGLARMEARVVFEELSSSLPSLRLTKGQTLRFAPNPLFRGPVSLLVEWDV